MDAGAKADGPKSSFRVGSWPQPTAKEDRKKRHFLEAIIKTFFHRKCVLACGKLEEPEKQNEYN